MAFDYQSTFRRIIAKTHLLEERYKLMASKKENAEAEVEQLRKALAQKDKRIHELETEAEYLRVAATVAPSREQVEETKALIADLVREIDRCIIDLSE